MDRFARTTRLAFCVVLTSSLGTALADETVEVTPWTAAEFGGKGGDALSLEKITPTGAVVLLNPHGETCTLRFPMKIGEKVRLRGATIGDQQAVCEVLLVSATEAPSAIFTFACLNQTPSAERKCPP
jgi:hypothetical protein